MSMNKDYLSFKYKPFKFFLITTLITWAMWFAAAYCSFHESLTAYKYVFVILGLVVPFAVAVFMIYGSGNDALKKDFRDRLTNFKLIKPKYLLIILLTMPVTVALAVVVSLLFGQPVTQFALSPGFSLAGWAAVQLLISVIIAPTFEETGWRGYGVDSLRRKGRSLFISTLIFAALWALWHMPLFFIKGYYHYEMLHTNIIYALNFIASVFALAFLANLIFYRNNRSIPGNILFHIMPNLCLSMFQIEEFTKCIVTVILLLFSVIVFFRFKPWWLDRTAPMP
jgi:membrane protease YdiL (CAAX protease family)